MASASMQRRVERGISKDGEVMGYFGWRPPEDEVLEAGYQAELEKRIRAEERAATEREIVEYMKREAGRGLHSVLSCACAIERGEYRKK